jgi:hypothetical protein
VKFGGRGRTTRLVLTGSRSSGSSSSSVPGSFPFSSMYLRMRRFSKTVPGQRLAATGLGVRWANATDLSSWTPQAPREPRQKLHQWSAHLYTTEVRHARTCTQHLVCLVRFLCELGIGVERNTLLFGMRLPSSPTFWSLAACRALKLMEHEPSSGPQPIRDLLPFCFSAQTQAPMPCPQFPSPKDSASTWASFQRPGLQYYFPALSFTYFSSCHAFLLIFLIWL